MVNHSEEEKKEDHMHNNSYCKRTKSWTDHHKAPEPFSSPLPTKKKNNSIKKKYGYGDLFKSSSSNGSDRGDCMSVGNSMRSKSTFGSDRDYRRKASNSYISSRGKSDNRIETQTSIDRRQPSFTSESDFPLLSPTSKEKKSINDSSSSPARQSSWSAVVGKIEKDNVTLSATHDDGDIIDGIPRLPLYAPASEETAAIDIDVNELVSSDEEEERIQSSKTYWQQSQQRQRVHSFHHYPSSSNRIKQQQNTATHFENKDDDAMYHPFSSFTTMSISALQNDIGTLLARSNRVDEAIKRYKLSIESARVALDEMAYSLEEEDNTNKNLCKENHPQKKCPKVTEAEGLAWFRQKLLRGDMVPAPIQTSDTEEMTEEEECEDGRNSPDLTNCFQPAGFGGCTVQSPRRLRSASFSVADLCPVPSKHKLSMPRIKQAKSIDQSPLQPSKISRNTSHPVTAPHPGKSMLANFQPHSTPQLSRTRSSSFYHRHPSHTHHSTVPSDDIVHDLHVHQKLDCPEEVYSCQGLTPLGLDFIIDPIPVLGSSLQSLVSSSTGTARRRSKLTIVETITLIAARLNLASLEYRKSAGGVEGDKLQVLNNLELALEDCLNTKDCNSTLFCQLKAIVHSNIGIVQYRLKKIRESMSSFEEAITSLEQGDALSEINFTQSTNETHDDNRIPPQSYLLLVIRLNLSRVSCRMNKLDDTSKFCKLIAEDNKPHRRNSSRRNLSNTGYQHTSFRRSNSFSATSSALDTAMASYDHDIDRRAKWLSSVAEHYITGLVHEANGEASDYKEAWHHYNRLLSLARVKLDHRHVYICTLLERRGAVLFEQRNLGGSLLSYLACMKILEHQQSTGSNIFNEADLGRILYSIGRVLHDNDEYHDAIHMYNRALVCQRNLASVSGRPSLDVITTLCNICRVHHLSGEIDAALAANREVLDLALMLVGGKMEHPFLINRLKIEGNILVEAGRLNDAMNTFVEAARRCSDDGRDEMMSLLVGGQTTSSSQEDADNGDSSVLSTRSAAALALEVFHQHAAAA